MLFAFHTLWGGVLTLLTGLLDTLDGTLARTLGEAEKYGAFLDSVLDRYAELVIYLGIWCYFHQQGRATALLSLIILLILFGSLMVSYARARAEGLAFRDSTSSLGPDIPRREPPPARRLHLGSARVKGSPHARSPRLCSLDCFVPRAPDVFE